MEMIGALRQTEGCLGVEAVGTMSGKRTIIAWFRDPESVKRWYYSDMHKGLMAGVAGDGENREPMQHIGDYAGPVMVMATSTPGGGIEAIDMPISQISIEMYAPLPGGAHINGRLAPAAFEVPHMRDFTPADPE